ncbi:MAG: DUF2971 domain-containing protein [Eubacterium sp.]|nr:DUF2971 domain-containing protein [Eubacterium sp.]
MSDFLYKFKSVRTVDDVFRLLDILDNHRLYMPTCEELNDPLEGNVFDISIGGYAGMSFPIIDDEEIYPIKKEKSKYRILSLSDDSSDPLLWAHYANEFSGICMCFDKVAFEPDCRRIEYTTKRIEKDLKACEDKLDDTIYESFFYKNAEWEYENEVRVVRRLELDSPEQEDENQKYLYFGDSLKAIIIGHNASKSLSGHLLEHYPKLVLLKTHVGYRSNRIRMLPFEYRLVYDGEEPPFIEDVSRYLRGIS